MSEPISRAYLATLFEMVGGDVAWLADLLDMYVADTTEKLSEADQAVGAGDNEALKKVAHTMKGTSVNIGANTMGSLCERLQRMATTGETGGAPALLQEIRLEFQNVCADIPAALDSQAELA